MDVDEGMYEKKNTRVKVGLWPRIMEYYDVYYNFGLSFELSPAQHVCGNALRDLSSTQSEDGGTHKAGFRSKKFEARSMTLTGSTGMIGKSSVRGKWVRPN
jgi:hypothetical protein